MNFLRTMDLYKVIILLALLLLPAAGGWVWWLHNQIALTQRALLEATRPGGLIQEIGSLQKQMQTVVDNHSRVQLAQSHNEYFEGVLYGSAKGGSVSRDDFTISRAVEQKASIGRDQRVVDYEVDITFGKQGAGRTDYPLPRDYIFAALYNGERQIWKLRSLEIVNATNERDLSGRKTPPPELEDKWIVRRLKFVRRTPAKDSR